MTTDPDELLRGFRHDVRSPLNVVLGFAVLLEDELDGEERESARHIRAAAEQILALVDGLPGDDRAEPASSPPAPPALSGVGEVVLVEDHASNVRLVERIVAHRPGVRLTTLTDPDAVHGWLAASTSVPHVVLLDRHLGRADGLDLVDPIRAVHPGVRIVVVTADATELARSEALAGGADEVMTKPFSVAALLETIDRSVAVP